MEEKDELGDLHAEAVSGLSGVACGSGGRIGVARVRWLGSHWRRRGSQHQLLT